MMVVCLEVLALADDVVGVWVRHMGPLNVDVLVICVRILLHLRVRVIVNGVLLGVMSRVMSAMMTTVQLFCIVCVRVNVFMMLMLSDVMLFSNRMMTSVHTNVVMVFHNVVVGRLLARLFQLVVLLDARVLVSHRLGSLHVLLLGWLRLFGRRLVMISQLLLSVVALFTDLVQRLFVLASHVLERVVGGSSWFSVMFNGVGMLGRMVTLIVGGVVGVITVVLRFDRVSRHEIILGKCGGCQSGHSEKGSHLVGIFFASERQSV